MFILTLFDIMPREISQAKKDKYCVVSAMCEIEKKTNKQTNIKTERDNGDYQRMDRVGGKYKCCLGYKLAMSSK